MTDAERAADKANQLLNDPVMKEAFAEVEKQAYEALLKVPDAGEQFDNFRRGCIDRINAIRDVKTHLGTTIKRGQLAAQQPRRVA